MIINTLRWLVYIKFVYVYIDYHTTGLLMSLTIVEMCVRSTKSAFADKGLSDETISLWGWLGWEVRIYSTMNWAVNPGESPQVTHRWKFLPKMGRTTCSTQENDLNILYIYFANPHIITLRVQPLTTQQLRSTQQPAFKASWSVTFAWAKSGKQSGETHRHFR